MAYGTGSAFRVDTREIQGAIRDLNNLASFLNATDSMSGTPGYTPAGTRLNREMRAAVRKIGENIIVPALVDAGHAHSTFAGRLADTARAVNDRIPVVKVGKTIPQLSGFSPKARKKLANPVKTRGQLARGAEFGPKGGAQKGKHKGLGVNYYGQPRNERGYWVNPTVQSARVLRPVLGEYAQVYDAALQKFGITRAGLGRYAQTEVGAP